MREGRLLLTGIVGSVLLTGLVSMIGLDLMHRTTTSRLGTPPVTDLPPPPAECCPSPDPVNSVRPAPAPPTLTAILDGADAMELQALDRDLAVHLSDKQMRRLREALVASVVTDVPSPSSLIERYPRMQLVLYGPAGSTVIHLNNLRLLSTKELGMIWTMPPGLWAEVESWFPPEASKPGELAFLLRAEQLIEPYPNGPIVYDAERSALMARLLQEGTPISQVAGGVQFTHTYVVEGKQYPVQVGDDWFSYSGTNYYLKEAALTLGASLHAN